MTGGGEQRRRTFADCGGSRWAGGFVGGGIEWGVGGRGGGGGGQGGSGEKGGVTGLHQRR